jgi:hypothetical protein
VIAEECPNRVTDAKKGLLTEPCPYDDRPRHELGGWHGGPTRGESEVPLMFNFNYEDMKQQQAQFVSTAITQALAEIGAGVRMNRHLTPIVVKIIENNRGGSQ